MLSYIYMALSSLKLSFPPVLNGSALCMWTSSGFSNSVLGLVSFPFSPANFVYGFKISLKILLVSSDMPYGCWIQL